MIAVELGNSDTLPVYVNSKRHWLRTQRLDRLKPNEYSEPWRPEFAGRYIDEFIQCLNADNPALDQQLLGSTLSGIVGTERVYKDVSVEERPAGH